MAFFSVFTVAILWKVISHLLTLSEQGNDSTLGIWLSNLPLIITALCALIALPYSVSRGASAITSLSQMVAAYKNGNAPQNPPPAPPAAPQQ